ncbi:FG-GAP-like repeat-containing protein [Aliifodinibius sp. S!AR15-10]|uniref:FG-GAP-like repeat-containing protein n=1 Tax=Aliifodinibius sp. S!AR15-10 TaxID=2950437 RepID=UPI00287054B4|nr:FG-GAP-like repeat-containing protein [Aliifodinibius sp. S!AR15-10]
MYKYVRSILLLLVIGGLITGCSSQNELQWNQEDGHRWAELSTGFFGSTGFRQLDPSTTNINFTNRVSDEDVTENRNYLNGSGVAAADVDGDGLIDLYFGQLNGPNKLYKNLGGLQFRNITDEAGVAHEGYNTSGVVFEDVDGDGDQDLLITSLTEGNELYINDGQGHFELRQDSGLGSSKGSNTMTLADIDGDGDLDLYVTNYKLKTARDIFTAEELIPKNTVKMQGDSLVVIPPYNKYYGIIETDGQSYRNEYGEEDELYINDGSGHFQRAEDIKQRFLDYNENPKGLPRDWGLTAKFHDINRDMLPDLYVANDFWTPDRIWINQGDGTFKGIQRNAIRSMSFSSMGVDFSDINRDGMTDIFVTEMLSADHQRNMRQFSDYLDPIDGRPQYNQNSMYLNRGDHTFAEIAYYSNLEATEWSWATKFLDIDLDGFEDLLITTGNGNDYQDMDTQMEMQRRDQVKPGSSALLEYPVLDLPNKMIKNNGDLTFADKSSEWGFEEEDISHGLAVADLDNDGDPDFVINRLNKAASVFENQSNAPRIAVQLNGSEPNTSAIGAKIELEGGPVVQQKEITSGGDYVSSSQKAVWFAASEGNTDHTLTVHWPDGKTSTIEGVHANRIYQVDEPAGAGKTTVNEEQKVASSHLFEDVSDRIDHTHHEDPFEDFSIQPLLPKKISRQGPGVSWIDYDRDGDDDLFVTSGKGGRLGLFANNGDGTFTPTTLEGISNQAAGDQSTVIGWGEAGRTQLMVGSANLEQGNIDMPSAHQFAVAVNQTVAEKQIPGILSTTGPLAAADYDGDGDIDLFVGGSFNPGRYPEDASSRLFINEQGNFVLDQVNSRKLNNIGLVSGATFSDIDRDGDPDLLLSREWDSLLLLENSNGNFNDASSEYGLNAYKGWWNGITTGDFNSDGRPDIVATNIGTNSVYQHDVSEPLKLFYQDFNMDGSLDIIDAYFDERQSQYVTRKKMYEFDSMPFIYRNVNTHSTFASASLNEVFGQDFSRVPSKEINTLQHMIFLNTDQGFEPRPLPTEAQFSTAFHSSVADFNNDGNEDLFLTQNFFLFPPSTPRTDAGRGLLLEGDGSGGFQVVKGQESGIMVYGDQRGAAVADFNNDGKTDLAVSQNEDETKLYLNQTEKQGYVVRLIGPEANRDALGSGIRVVYQDDTKGPWREIKAGTGYRSQPSAVQVLGYEQEVTAIEVSWFDGTTKTVQAEAGKWEYSVRY